MTTIRQRRLCQQLKKYLADNKPMCTAKNVNVCTKKRFLFNIKGKLARVGKCNFQRLNTIYLTENPPLSSILQCLSQTTAGHLGTRQIHNNLRRHFYWPHMALALYSYVKKMWVLTLPKTFLKTPTAGAVMLAKRTYRISGFDHTGLPDKTKARESFCGCDDRPVQQNHKAILTTTVTGLVVAIIILKSWILPHKIPCILLSHKAPQYESKIISVLCALLEIGSVTTMEFHPQSIRPVKLCNKTLVACLCHYIDGRQTDWDVFLQHIIYGYNKQVHCTKGSSVSCFSLFREPLEERPGSSEKYLQSP